MEYPVFFPETALALFRALLYSMACILAGAAVIALSVYAALVCLEIFSSQPSSKARRAKASQSARLVPVAETPVLSATEQPILAAPERLSKEGVRVRDAHIAMAVPRPLESDLT
jgi:hypothetical protein